MATFAQGQAIETPSQAFGQAAGLSPVPAADAPAGWTPETAGGVGGLVSVSNRTAPSTTALGSAYVAEQSTVGFDFFERFHVVPRSFDLGNVVSSQSIAFEVFSAYRRAVAEWTSLTNNAGAGTTVGGAPALPTDVDPLTGFSLTLDVSSMGAPFVDGDLTFVFASGTTIVPVVIQRIVLWGLEPEMPFSLVLSYLTNVHRRPNGEERRQSTRKRPRWAWRHRFIAEQGPELATLENLLFDFHALSFGLPLWVFDTELTVAASATDTSVTVESTDYRDFRVGGLAVILTDQSTFDVLEIDSLTSTTLTFSSELLNSYPIGTTVAPLSACTIDPSVSGARWPVGLGEFTHTFLSTDNDVDLADLTPFDSFDGKLLVSDCNVLPSGKLQETYAQSIVVIDSETGIREQFSSEDRHRRAHPVVLRAVGRQAVWELIGLAFALRGQQVSFYVARFQDDLEVVATLSSGSNTMDVTRVGYAQHVRERQPKNVVRLTFTDGTTLTRTVMDSSILTSTTEQLELDSTWPTTRTASEVERVEYLEKVRLATDDVEISFEIGDDYRALLQAPVEAVFE